MRLVVVLVVDLRCSRRVLRSPRAHSSSTAATTQAVAAARRRTTATVAQGHLLRLVVVLVVDLRCSRRALRSPRAHSSSTTAPTQAVAAAQRRIDQQVGHRPTSRTQTTLRLAPLGRNTARAVTPLRRDDIRRDGFVRRMLPQVGSSPHTYPSSTHTICSI